MPTNLEKLPAEDKTGQQLTTDLEAPESISGQDQDVRQACDSPDGLSSSGNATESPPPGDERSVETTDQPGNTPPVVESLRAFIADPDGDSSSDEETSSNGLSSPHFAMRAHDDPLLPQGDNRRYMLIIVSSQFEADFMDVVRNPPRNQQNAISIVLSDINEYNQFVRDEQLPNDGNHFGRFTAARFARALPRNVGFQFLGEESLVSADELGGRRAGMTDDEVSDIPLATVDLAMIEGQPTCSICMVGYQVDQVVNQLNCGHRFHPDCIGQWMRTQRSCPYCRTIQ